MAEVGAAPNPFAGHVLRNPRFTAAEARAIARERFGVDGPAHELGSHQDQNFRIDAPERRYVLRIANEAFARAELELQDRAAEHLAGGAFEVPRVVAARDGSEIVAVERDGAVHDIRLVTFIEGEPLQDARHLAPAVRERLGGLAGLVAAGLASFSHPADARTLQWDPRLGAEVVAALGAFVREPGRRALVERLAAEASAALAPLADALPRQVVHCDVTSWNVVGRRDPAGRLQPVGVIDFGDMTRTYRLCELAVATASGVQHAPATPLAAAMDVTRGYNAALPLDAVELAAAYPLLVLRAVLLAVGTEQQAVLEPGNVYAQEAVDLDWVVPEALADVPLALGTAALRAACGADPAPSAPRLRLGDARPVVDVGATRLVDLGTRADAFGEGAFRHAEGVAAAVGPLPALGRHGEARLPHTRERSATEPATVHLGADVFAAAGTEVRAPLDGTVARASGLEVVLVHAVFRTRIAGIEPAVDAGAALRAGDLVGRIAPAAARLPPHVHVQLLAPGLVEAPGLAPASLAEPWLALCPDPSALVGAPVAAARADAAALLERRLRHVASPQEHYYAAPPQVERGLGQFLYDEDGRAYLDAVNNVAVLGHSHPAVTAAATRQLRLLNTNSRFLYASMARFAERLAALVPDPLDTVFLVSTGSEANDLALRLARAATGARDVLAIAGAYHGWTTATDEISTSPVDNPRAAETLPEWVHPVLAPNTYRGPYGADDPEAGVRYAAALGDVVDRVVADGRSPAAFVAEALYGNAGGLVLPDGYLREAYARVRAAGGLCIADEVQVGYGRLGEWFWAFEQQGVVPDIVTIAKSTGNGHPVAAVLTTRAIADAFGRFGSFFASVGGGPVSCEVGLAVLDVIEAEGLQENARHVGARLRAGLAGLVERHALAGAAHGVGLYLGLELVRDRATKEPATAEAAAICERARELGLIVQPTGDHANVLKIKPPLVVEAADADFLVATLDRVLAEGW
jgi:4-aminobutyrate aminotransferase-like enzyme/Ser/Thr protein kinase RdoA (MazF antagonist)